MRVVKIKGAEKGKERVCAYVRVSTDKEDQLHSFVAQSEYWKKKLSENKSYQYIGIFADEGLSGKSMKNRAELNEMLDLARKGQIDRIFVKSIARFARNYIETIETIRELRQLNIPVNFDEEGIDTNDPKCNLLLNVYASLAEEELRSMSENQKWSVRKRFENGSVEIGKMYGYEYIDGKLIVNPREAEAVRLIFKLYLEGYGYDKIAQKLEDEGYRTKYGKVMWASAAIQRMLKNEKYTGNALMQKYYNINMTQKKNNGELPQFYIENSHKAIISPEDYEKAQKQMAERAEKHLKHGAKRKSYPLSGKIVCGKCGKKYGRKIAAKGKSYECVKWMCRMKNEKTALACHNTDIKDSIVTELLINAYNEFLDKRKESNEVTIETDKLKKLLEDEKELKSLYARGYIIKEQYTGEQSALVEQIKAQEKRIEKLTKGEVNYGRLSKAETLTAEVVAALEIIEVNNYTVTFKFINGYTVKNKYDNGRAGNVNGKLKIKT
jgi:DNA invertase Pin-like site-specific DNA recombinase